MNEITITYSVEQLLKMFEEMKTIAIFALVLSALAIVACGFIFIKSYAERD